MSKKVFFNLNSEYGSFEGTTHNEVKFNLGVSYKINSIKLRNIALPNTAYNITGGASLKFTDQRVTREVTVAPGSYDIYTLLNELESKVNTTAGSSLVNLEFNTERKKVEITSVRSISFFWSKVLGRALGFNEGQSATGTSFESEKMINVAPPHFYYIDLAPM